MRRWAQDESEEVPDYLGLVDHGKIYFYFIPRIMKNHYSKAMGI